MRLIFWWAFHVLVDSALELHDVVIARSMKQRAHAATFPPTITIPFIGPRFGMPTRVFLLRRTFLHWNLVVIRFTLVIKVNLAQVLLARTIYFFTSSTVTASITRNFDFADAASHLQVALTSSCSLGYFLQAFNGLRWHLRSAFFSGFISTTLNPRSLRTILLGPCVARQTICSLTMYQYVYSHLPFFWVQSII